MNFASIGDLAQSFQTRRQNATLKAQVATLSNELASGRVSDTAAAVSGDFAPIAGIQSALSSLKSYKITSNEAAVVAEAFQSVLLTIQSTSSELGPAVLASGNSAQPAILMTTSVDAREKLDGAVSRLNMQVAGRSLFAGAALDKPALAGADVIMADVMSSISGLTTATDISAAVDTWFGPGGGFETAAYLGAATPATGFQLAPGETAQITATAQDSSIRDILKGFVLSSIVAEGGLSGSTAEATALMTMGAEQLITAQDDLAVLQSAVGSIQARIDRATTSNSAEISALEIARGNILGVDPYEVATRLEETRTQLETLYAITARSSRLSLVDFLR